MAMLSVCPDITLSDPKTDYRNSQRIEQYRFGSEAVYMAAWPSAKYLPYTAVVQDTGKTVWNYYVEGPSASASAYW